MSGYPLDTTQAIELNEARSTLDLKDRNIAANSFKELLMIIIEKIVNCPDRGAEIELCNMLTKTLKEDVADDMSIDEQFTFYNNLREIFSTFFGVTNAHPEQYLAGLVRDLTICAFPDLAIVRDNGYTKASKVRTLIGKIDQEIAKKTSSEINEGSFLDSVFGNEQILEAADFMEKFAASKTGLPADCVEAVEKQVNGMTRSGKAIARRAIESNLKKLKKKALPADDEGLVGLQTLRAFIASLESRRVDLKDLTIIDFLRGHMDENKYRELVAVPTPSLTDAVVHSGFNGRKLDDDGFTQMAKDQALAAAAIDTVDINDFRSLAGYLIKVAKGALSIEDIDLRTGIGASASPPPLRVISYVIPSLLIARRCQEKFGKSPKIEFFTGQEGGIYCNGMDADIVRANTRTVFQLVQEFVDTFFPDVADRFSLEEDREWSDPKIQLVVEYFENLLTTEVSKGEDQRLVTIARELDRRGTVYGGEQVGAVNSLKYAAFHAICFQDIPTVNRYISGNGRVDRNVVSIGGEAEGGFDHVRDFLVRGFSISGFNEYATAKGYPELSMSDELPNLSTRASMICDTGNIPPYFLVRRGGDIAIEETSTLEVDGIRALVAERIINALTIIDQKGENDQRTISGARSLLRGLAMIAAITEVDPLVEFIKSFNDRQE